MEQRDFIYWLRGYLEAKPGALSGADVKVINEHLDTLFTPKEGLTTPVAGVGQSIFRPKDPTTTLIC